MKELAPRTVLIIEDDAGLRVTLVAALEAKGYEVRSCAGADEGLQLAATFQPTLVVCDVHLTQGDGRKVLAKLRTDKNQRYCQFVLMTGDWVGASQRASIDFGADDYLPKPFTSVEFLACVEARFQQADI